MWAVVEDEATDEAIDERGLEALRVRARGLERGAQLRHRELLALLRRGGALLNFQYRIFFS